MDDLCGAGGGGFLLGFTKDIEKLKLQGKDYTDLVKEQKKGSGYERI